jgi:hypothetical protein
METLPSGSTSTSPIRPRSVAILVGIQALQGLILLGLGVYRVFLPPGWADLSRQELQFLPLVLFDNLSSGILMVLFGSACLIIAYELLRLRSWAWMADMILQGVGLLAALVAYIQHRPNYIGMFVGIVIVFYLNTQEIQAVFRQKLPAQAPNLAEDHS